MLVNRHNAPVGVGDRDVASICDQGVASGHIEQSLKWARLAAIVKGSIRNPGVAEQELGDGGLPETAR